MLLFALLAVALAPAAAQSTAVATTPAPAIAFDGALNARDSGLTLELKFDRQPEMRTFLMEAPYRVVFEFENTRISLPDDFQEAAGDALRQVSFGAVTSDRSRLVLITKTPMQLSNAAFATDSDTERATLKASIEPVSPGDFQNAVKAQQALIGTSGKPIERGDRVRRVKRDIGRFVIALDPGHGGIDGGSAGRATGIAEKEITLTVAKLLGAKLEAAGPFEVVYTRDSDVFVSLRERRAVAQRANADLMISIHADSLRQTFVRGATVYTLSERASDSLAQEVADSENLSDLVAGLAAPQAADAVTDILADLTMRETTHFSRAFSAMLIRRMKTRMELINNPQRSASFAVLKSAEVPGVLLELGYLSNKNDEKQLSNPEWQERAATIIAQAVVDFFENRTPVGAGR